MKHGGFDGFDGFDGCDGRDDCGSLTVWQRIRANGCIVCFLPQIKKSLEKFLPQKD
jgi:hypothetical protein